jgi:ribosomal protein L24E
MPGGRDKFKQGTHFCRTPLRKREGKVYVCRDCGAVYTCKLIKGRLSWLLTKDGRWK